MSRPLNFDFPVIDDIGDIHTLTEYIQKNGTDPETIEGLENKIEAVEDIISDEWDVTKTYVAGDYYIYNNKLYIVKITGTGFDPTDTEYAKAVTVASEFTDLNSNLSELNAHIDSRVYISSYTTWNEAPQQYLRSIANGVDKSINSLVYRGSSTGAIVSVVGHMSSSNIFRGYVSTDTNTFYMKFENNTLTTLITIK